MVTRTPTAEFPDKMAVASEKVLEAEDIINFTPEAIHQVEVIGEEPIMWF
ncbi:MAG: cupin [Microcystis sp. M069S2]|nr:cupin [Microcystis sp. M091S2]MCA2647880.1 cupin [Microcystis sp. M069S2]MCA2661847.1 cupin [Microcystis sp. M064S2]MCA2677800.1 cupin [Microcystis sp. M054S2]MCA2771177.1 cupin [Microcystis sp. M122S2]MCA2787471.1 cupin [Microcystis sp. M116S2]MCA2797080.1 cupin [Microcystis sp. M100S2]MCA2818728.1 cupin [Microcystis sp. M085S1]MCA2820435.1 cupin [Microcystis sp. M083S1]MCA2855394.1 cupin [Microcystis sp. M065S1]MCA2881820.1 cupin [Microcystis sp. M046S1]MCA2886569.1 cupin [Microcyst